MAADVGDRVLKELSQRMLRNLREGDSVARYAGDEFLILLESIENRATAEQVRRSLESLLAQPLSPTINASQEIPNRGAAIGIALYPQDGLDVETLIRVRPTRICISISLKPLENLIKFHSQPSQNPTHHTVLLWTVLQKLTIPSW